MNQTQQIIHSICHAHTQDKEHNMYEEVFIRVHMVISDAHMLIG